MKTTALLLPIAIFFCLLTACSNPRNTEARLADSTALGGRADSAAKADTLPEAKNELNESVIDEDGAQFMKSAAMGSKKEIEMGKVAMQKAADQDVRKFAAKMVADHTMANSDLIKLGQSGGIILPTDFPAEVRTKMDSVKQLSGKTFDQNYMKMMVEDHDKTVSMFKSAASLRDDKLRDFAASQLPTLQNHQKMAKEIFNRLR